MALLAGCAMLSQLFPSESPYRPDDISDAAVRLPGAESFIAGIALKDLIDEERAETAKMGGLGPDGGVRDPDGGGSSEDGGWDHVAAFIARCFQDPATYEVWVDLDRAARRWKVIVLPEAPCTVKIIGGGAEYEIDADTYEILHRERME
ncbi:MAG TPA: hypothetical protein VIG99_01825 [Myxococcaceae bacterium]|jgi:hypothetical protein